MSFSVEIHFLVTLQGPAWAATCRLGARGHVPLTSRQDSVSKGDERQRVSEKITERKKVKN